MRRRLLAAVVVGLALVLPPPRLHHARADDTFWVRVTFYTLDGITASGAPVGPGVAACSYEFALGQHVLVWRQDGGAEVFVCLDRGLLGPMWIDIWGRPDAPWTFGDYAPAELLTDGGE